MSNFAYEFINTLNAYVDSIPNWTESNKIAFTIGTFPVAWYGILISIGFICAIALASIKLHFWYKVPVDPFIFFCIIGIPISILGGRAWSFAIGDSHDTNFFDFKKGGMAIQGAIVATVIAALIWFPIILRLPKYQIRTRDLETDKVNIRQISMWVYADAIIPCILIGQVIGRWGNFMNQELYGPAANGELLWLKYTMPLVWKWMHIDGKLHHPFFLYESFFNFWFFIILYVAFEFISFLKAGDIGISYFIFYGVLRICMEPFRENGKFLIPSVTTSAIYITSGIVMLVLNHLLFVKMRIYRTSELCLKFLSYYCCFLWAVPSLSHEHETKHTYGYKKPFKYKREESEMLYYNGK